MGRWPQAWNLQELTGGASGPAPSAPAAAAPANPTPNPTTNPDANPQATPDANGSSAAAQSSNPPAVTAPATPESSGANSDSAAASNPRPGRGFGAAALSELAPELSGVAGAVTAGGLEDCAAAEFPFASGAASGSPIRGDLVLGSPERPRPAPMVPAKHLQSAPANSMLEATSPSRPFPKSCPQRSKSPSLHRSVSPCVRLTIAAAEEAPEKANPEKIVRAGKRASFRGGREGSRSRNGLGFG